MPVLLMLGIIAQVILLVIVVILYVPLLIWPQLADGPALAITRGFGRMVVRGAMKYGPKQEVAREESEVTKP
jgi:hypothetical protein